MSKKRNDTATTSRKTSTAQPVTSTIKATTPAAAAPLPTAFANASRPPAPRPTPRSVPQRPQPSNLASLFAHNDQVRRDRIAKAAYFLAERTGFRSDPVQNWLEAEREIDSRRAS